MNNPLWQSFQQSGLVGQSILVILFGASIIVWTIVVHKLILLRQIGKAGQIFLSRFRRIKQGLFSLSPPPGSPELEPVYSVYRRGCEELAALSEGANPAKLPAQESWEGLEEILQRTAGEQIQYLGKNLIFLATAASTGPLLGILGTVWGVLVAFREMGRFGSATLDAVAPGISEALITTVGGLVVAIPALIAYNYFNHEIERFYGLLDNFILEFLTAAKSQFSQIAGRVEKDSPKRKPGNPRSKIPELKP